MNREKPEGKNVQKSFLACGELGHEDQDVRGVPRVQLTFRSS